MSNNIAELPISTKISYIRQALERERGMRLRVLKGDSQRKGMEEMNRCLIYLEDLAREQSKPRQSA
ncbi:MAG: hypothetical protein WCL30_04105 [Pseudomonadota bacterium]